MYFFMCYYFLLVCVEYVLLDLEGIYIEVWFGWVLVGSEDIRRGGYSFYFCSGCIGFIINVRYVLYIRVFWEGYVLECYLI